MTQSSPETIGAVAMFEAEWGEGAWQELSDDEREKWEVQFKMGLNAYLSTARMRCSEADYEIGWWLSAALEDPQVCAEMKADIYAWFEAHQPSLWVGWPRGASLPMD